MILYIRIAIRPQVEKMYDEVLKYSEFNEIIM